MDPQPLKHPPGNQPEPALGITPKVIDTDLNRSRDRARNAERSGGNPDLYKGAIEFAERNFAAVSAAFAEHGITVSSEWTQPNREQAPHTYTTSGLRDASEPELELIERYLPEVYTPGQHDLREYLAGNPKPPFVVKCLINNYGVNKFLIEADWQLARLNAWVESEPSYTLQFWAAEPFIEGVSEYATTYRVVVGATGIPIAAGISCSTDLRQTESMQDTDKAKGWDKSLTDPESPYYLASREFRSNSQTRSRVIPLAINGRLEARDELSDEDEQILAQHGIQGRELPPVLLEQASKIAKLVGPSKCLVLGIDFLQGKDGKYYFLEANAMPATRMIRAWWDIDPATGDDEVYASVYKVIAQDMARIYGPPLSAEELKLTDNS